MIWWFGQVRRIRSAREDRRPGECPPGLAYGQCASASAGSAYGVKLCFGHSDPVGGGNLLRLKLLRRGDSCLEFVIQSEYTFEFEYVVNAAHGMGESTDEDGPALFLSDAAGIDDLGDIKEVQKAHLAQVENDDRLAIGNEIRTQASISWPFSSVTSIISTPFCG